MALRNCVTFARPKYSVACKGNLNELHNFCVAKKVIKKNVVEQRKWKLCQKEYE